MAKCENCKNLYNLSDENDVIVGKWCPKIVDCPDIERDRKCEYFKPMTNSDQIRNMRDLDLAIDRVEMMHDLYNGLWVCTDGTTFCDGLKINRLKAIDHELDWLQSAIDEAE